MLALDERELRVALVPAVLREYREQPVLHQRDALAADGRGQRDKADVDAPVRQPLLNVVIVPVEELEFDLRIVVLELLQHRRQPVDGDGGERAYAHRARFKPADGRGSLIELLCAA